MTRTRWRSGREGDDEEEREWGAAAREEEEEKEEERVKGRGVGGSKT